MTPETIRELARAQRLALSDAEVAVFGRDLEALEELCLPLQAVSADFFEQSRAKGLDAMRCDLPSACLAADAVAALTQGWEDGYIAVPRTVEEGGEAPCKASL